MKVFRKNLVEFDDCSEWANKVDGKEVVKEKDNMYHPKEEAYKDFIIDGAWVEDTELQDRIDKAIEYIDNDLKSFIYGAEYKTLMKILKGESND